MITVTYREDDDSFKLHVSGHAKFGAYGQDIVCAAISALVQTLGLRMDDVTPDYTYDIQETGDVYISALGKRAVDAFDTIMTGIRQVATQYPDNVRIYTEKGA